jgi:hypothetical protein
MLGFGFAIVLTGALFVEASAGLSVSLFQVVAENDTFIPAIAMTQKASIALPRISEGKDGQASETLACEIAHASIITGRENCVHPV